MSWPKRDECFRGLARCAMRGGMIRQRKPLWVLAAGLAMLAGYVDAIGFLRLGGLFVSFMSGNSTQLGVAIAGHAGGVAVAAGLLACFVLGVVLGARVALAAGRRRKPAVLALVTLLLALATLVGTMTAAPMAALFLLALAMGAENNVFQRGGEVSVGVTYMTGTLVKLGQNLAMASAGGPRWRWLPYLLLWAGLVAGAVTGAALYPLHGLYALWGAVAAAGVLTVMAWSVGPVQAWERS
ncbi:uncharacterized membrane protein YoaK (UPF0700 family) [Sphingomonas sp. SORGH_AS802]|nr:uncharacterized membrane protein YoaK (UPF0700 family) [Sphingomonas sp. SORGH_AS_0438]MDR6135600.1 uncharacterized membrane protein YoaK (UPF0700 family) [Sphingomonas sp. SORGH_AS_0802]